MKVQLEKWYRPKIDKEILKELSQKSDMEGLSHMTIFFSVLIIVGIFAYLTWGTWWSVLWFYIYLHKSGYKVAHIFVTNEMDYSH